MTATAADPNSAPDTWAKAGPPRRSAYPTASQRTQRGFEYASTRGDSGVRRSPCPCANERAYASEMPASSVTSPTQSACTKDTAAAAMIRASASRARVTFARRGQAQPRAHDNQVLLELWQHPIGIDAGGA